MFRKRHLLSFFHEITGVLNGVFIFYSSFPSVQTKQFLFGHLEMFFFHSIFSQYSLYHPLFILPNIFSNSSSCFNFIVFYLSDFMRIKYKNKSSCFFYFILIKADR